LSPTIVRGCIDIQFNAVNDIIIANDARTINSELTVCSGDGIIIIFFAVAQFLLGTDSNVNLPVSVLAQ